MDDTVKILNTKAVQAVIDQVKDMVRRPGSTDVSVFGWWGMGQRWARNKATLTSDQRDVRVLIRHQVEGPVSVVTNQIDSDSIAAACRMLGSYLDRVSPKETFIDMMQEPVTHNAPGAEVWSDATFNRQALQNAEVVGSVTDDAQAKGFLASGYMENAASSVVKYNRDPWGREFTTSGQITQAHCSMTIREAKGNGSGWAGGSAFDINRLDASKIAAQALEKCTLSLNPVRIEPGRYQTILEPQASSFFFSDIVAGLQRSSPEGSGGGQLYLETDMAVNRHRSKLGLRIVDERITISHDPTDPVVGTHAEPGFEAVNLIENGVLKNMWVTYEDSLKELVQKSFIGIRSSFRVQGTETKVEEMISTVKRGLLVTRISNPVSVGMLYTGTTRDGLWLIENGKLTKAVRNFRWTESPWFVLNNVEELGQAIPVFTPADIRRSLERSYSSSLTSIVAPWIKINDFSFTSTVDAI